MTPTKACEQVCTVVKNLLGNECGNLTKEAMIVLSDSVARDEKCREFQAEILEKALRKYDGTVRVTLEVTCDYSHYCVSVPEILQYKRWYGETRLDALKECASTLIASHIAPSSMLTELKKMPFWDELQPKYVGTSGIGKHTSGYAYINDGPKIPVSAWVVTRGDSCGRVQDGYVIHGGVKYTIAEWDAKRTGDCFLPPKKKPLTCIVNVTEDYAKELANTIRKNGYEVHGPFHNVDRPGAKLRVRGDLPKEFERQSDDQPYLNAVVDVWGQAVKKVPGVRFRVGCETVRKVLT